MAELETQVGQIFISDKKLSKSFISLYSEDVEGSAAESFLLIEIPVLNPAIWGEYERMAELLQASLVRNLRAINPNSFENAVAQLNDDLAAVASEGQTTWIGKFSACVAAKVGGTVYVATAGKVHAYIYRDGQLSNIADSEKSNNPLKTFSNFAQGKIKEKDILILSTPQLFNYISVERLKNLLTKKSIPAAAEDIAQLVKNSADDDVSFGTFILKISEAGSAEKSIIDLSKAFGNDGKPFTDTARAGLRSAARIFAAVFTVSRRIKKPEVRLPALRNINLKEFFLNLAALFSVNRFMNLPRAKKFFFVAAAIFVLALIVNLGVVIHSHNHAKAIAKLNTALDEVENQINNANAAFIIHDESKAISAMNDAEARLATIPDQKEISVRKASIVSDLKDLENSVGHFVSIDPAELITYPGASVDEIEIIDGQIFLINHKGSLIAPFAVSSKSLGKDSTLSAPAFKNSAAQDGKLFFEDAQGNIYEAATDLKSVARDPAKLPENGIGFEIYGSPEKAYAVNTGSNQIVFGNVKSFQGTSEYIKDGTQLSGALDMAIDGSVYVLTRDGVLKFTRGAKQTFADLGMHFQNNARIKAGAKYLYVMDPSTRRVIVENKSGGIVGQYTSPKFDDMRDIAVDENTRTVYVFSGSKLYSFKTQP